MIPKLEIFLNNRSTTIHRLLHILFTYDALFNWTIVKICILYTMISRAQTHFIFCYQPKNNGTELQRRTKLSRNDLGFQLTYRAALKTWKALGSSVSQLEAEMLPVDTVPSSSTSTVNQKKRSVHPFPTKKKTSSSWSQSQEVLWFGKCQDRKLLILLPPQSYLTDPPLHLTPSTRAFLT